jgi:glutathione S-transferase
MWYRSARHPVEAVPAAGPHPVEEIAMTSQEPVILYYVPQSRAALTRVLLEELGAPYELRLLDMRAGEQRQPAYLAVNPMGKVPAISHRGQIVTEQVAIFLYLADAFPEAGLAPALTDPLRGPYLRWMIFYASCFEPAVTDRSMQHEPPPPSRSGYGDFDTMFRTLTAQLEKGPFILGERFTAADILWGGVLTWVSMLDLIPKAPAVEAHVARHAARPSVQRARAKDAELIAAWEAGRRTE